ncbi:MAG TPA: immunoglobulin domain-containing protein [Verrucomicrobiae bacterium]|jgi:hypothetical protein
MKIQEDGILSTDTFPGLASFYAILFITLVFALELPAQTIVSNLDGAGFTAVAQAGGTVTFATDGVIVLTNTITLHNDVVLDGTGHSVTISGGGAVRLFVLPVGYHLTLRNLTLTQAFVGGCGGAIFSQGFLNVENCNFVSNTVTYPNNEYGELDGGGAIYNAGALTLSNSTFLGNSSTGGAIGPGIAKGGAIFNDGGSLNLADAVFTGNSATGQPGAYTVICRGCPIYPSISGGGSGGAIYSTVGTVLASNLLIAGNSAICPTPTPGESVDNNASPATGGAVCIETGDALFANCIFSNNLASIEPGSQVTAPSAGGSVYNAGSLVLSNCAILDSVADNGSSEGATGGGAYNSGALLLYGTMISDNSVGSVALPGLGGGIFNAGSLQIKGCTVSSNSADGGSGGGIGNSGITSVSNTTVISSGSFGTNTIGIGIYNSGVFLADSASFLMGIPAASPGSSFRWELDGTNIQGAISNTLNLKTIQFARNGAYSLLMSNSTGTATNFSEILNQPATNAPTFTLQPIGETTNVGAHVKFQAVAVGFPAPTYHWRFNGKNLAGATTSALTLSPVKANQAGNYSVLASNMYGAITSQVVVLTIEETNLVPGIAQVQPQSQIAPAGTKVVFSAASPHAGVSYQWLKNGAPLAGQTNSKINLANVSAKDDGAYSLLLRSGDETLTGGSAFLSVITGPPKIIAQPQDASLADTGPAVLSVGVAGGGIANPPEVVSGRLQLWLKADAGAVIAANGRVVRWQDQSGNNNDAIQANTNAEPSIAYPSSLGGIAAIRFSGAQSLPNGEYLAGSGTVGTLGDMTTFMVYDVSTSAIPYQVAFFTGVPAGVSAGSGDDLVSGEMAFTTWGQTFNSGYLVPTNTYRIWSDRISGNETILEFFDDTLNTSSDFKLPFNPQALPGSGYYIGGVDPTLPNVGAGYNFAGDIAELMVYEGALGESDRMAVVNYLKEKYYQINPGGVSYQWNCNGTNVAGATNATLVFAAGQPAQTGVYNVVVSNQFGEIVSSNATLSISPSSRFISVLDENSLALALEEGGQITFTTNGTILSTSSTTLLSDAIVDGTGHSITLSGGGATRLFDVPEGVTLTLRNLTLANAAGGALSVEGSLILENCVLTNNAGVAGGAIQNTGQLSVTNCLFVGNSVVGGNPACGGAIWNSNGVVRLNDVIFSNNYVAGSGPGISYIQQPPPANGGNGCGGALFSTNGEVWAVNVCLISNTASCLGGPGPIQYFKEGTLGVPKGGAVYFAGGTSVFAKSMFSNNAALGATSGSVVPGSSDGGAIFNSGSMIITQSVLAQNTTIGGASEVSCGPSQGGAIYNSGNLQVLNSFVSNNTATGGTASSDTYGSNPGLGGALYNTGNILISDSVVSSNAAIGGYSFVSFVEVALAGDGDGGAIYNAGSATISSSSIFANTALGGNPAASTGDLQPRYASGVGGAIANLGVIQLSNVPLSNNVASGAIIDGETIYNSGAFLTDSNTVVVPNSTGSPPLVYDWQLNGIKIAGATSSTFNLTNVQFAKIGTYTLLISNSAGLVTNFVEIFNEPATNAPSFVLQPASLTTNLGATIDFEAAAIGFPAPVYQWLFKGTNIAGATNSALVLTNVLQNQSGMYTVTAKNYLGSATSQPAMLTVEGELLLTTFEFGTNGFNLTAEAMPGQNIIIESSTNLLDWLPILTNTSPLTFIDTNGPESRARFYRAVVAP